MHRYWNELTQLAERMDTEHWVLALVGMIVVGLICMHGFGSRSNY
jgi:hypothetical protein